MYISVNEFLTSGEYVLDHLHDHRDLYSKSRFSTCPKQKRQWHVIHHFLMSYIDTYKFYSLAFYHKNISELWWCIECYCAGPNKLASRARIISKLRQTKRTKSMPYSRCTVSEDDFFGILLVHKVFAKDSRTWLKLEGYDWIQVHWGVIREYTI